MTDTKKTYQEALKSLKIIVNQPAQVSEEEKKKQEEQRLKEEQAKKSPQETR